MHRSRSLNLLEFDPEIEGTFRKRLREQNELKRQQRDMEHQEGHLDPLIQHEQAPRDGVPPGFDNQAGRVQNPVVNEEDMLFRDFLNRPIVENQAGIIYPSYGHPNFQLRPDVINLFSNSLSFYDKAREWIDTLPARSITSWVESVQKFTTKFFPPARVAKLKHDITTFQQLDSETFHEAWERFKDMLRKCPNNGITLPQQVQYFYAGLTPSHRSNVDSLSNGSIQNKSIREAYELFEVMSEQSAMWPDRRAKVGVSGARESEAFSLMLSKIDFLARKVEGLSTSSCGSHSAHMVQSLSICEMCGANHLSSGCPLIASSLGSTEQLAYTQNFQRPGNVLNPKPQEKKEGWEEAIAKLANHQLQYQERNDASLKNLERQVGLIAKLLSERPQGALPSDTETNPRENAKAIITRSGIQLPEPTEPLTSKTPILVKAYIPPIPFPQRLQKHKLDIQFGKFLEVFKKLHINILFADALAQMPSYAKFMKDILSNKRKLEEHETVMLTEECSAILQNKLPPKIKDPRSFTILCAIGDLNFTKALCDLGASINLMPLSIFEKLGMGEAKATTVSLQLADRSIKYPRGVVEDVLVRVDKFIFPTDFIILDMEADNDIPIILGRPFLATG
ncbi:uncharacterized protein LOC111411325 [Olea europaea var. sylvestris]|uniref:uncharacterized protein LOC111411325 n=1 Tax=Olea europaea var. sylvestris TaxID=158386 RepID=UPI000C1D599D|nr:uncharacterized protein LOC111411325 [Olea europaea var. sylvestris]